MTDMHATKNDDSVAGRLDLVAVELEAAADAERGDLALDQPLARLRQCPLRLANANRERAAFGLAGLDQELAEEMRFSRAPAPVRPFVPRGLEQWREDFSRWNFQGRQ
jgi:hypothetical protein